MEPYQGSPIRLERIGGARAAGGPKGRAHGCASQILPFLTVHKAVRLKSVFWELVRRNGTVSRFTKSPGAILDMRTTAWMQEVEQCRSNCRAWPEGRRAGQPGANPAPATKFSSSLCAFKPNITISTYSMGDS